MKDRLETSPNCELPASSKEAGDDIPAPGQSLNSAALAAPLLLSILLVILDAAASWRIPLQKVIPWIYTPTLLVAAVCLLVTVRFSKRFGPFVCTIILAVLAAYLAMVAFFGSWRPDPTRAICMGFDDWCYQALGNYLWNNPRGRIAGMSMIDEFGSHLRDSRFSAPCLLEFLGSRAPFKDPAMSHFMLGVICLAVHFSSMLYLGRALLPSRLAAGAAAFLSTAGGWMSEVLELGNYDNLIFLALVPALIGVLVRLEVCPSRSWRLTAAGGVLLAAVVETFPEGVPLLGVMLVPFTVILLLRGVRHRRLLLPYIALLILGLALASPYLPVFRTFFLHQIQWAQDVVKAPVPRNFPGLVDGRRLPAFFALGEEVFGASFTVWNNVVPLILLVLLAAGAWSWRRLHPSLSWVIVSLGALLLWQNVFNKYDYGTYKVLACAGWWIYLSVVAGTVAAVRWMRLPGWSVALFLALLSTAIGWDKYEHRIERPPLFTSLIGPLRELTYVRFITQQDSLLVDLDPFEYTWAVYYLRKFPITTFKQQGMMSMPHILPYAALGLMPPPASSRFAIVEGRRTDALWYNDRFSLIPFRGAYIGGVSGPIPSESAPGLFPCVWVGSKPETFRIVSAAGGEFALQVHVLGIGPRSPSQDSIHFEITDSAGTRPYQWQPGGGPRVFPLHLLAGENLVAVRCTDAPLPVPASGDLRETMLLVGEYSVAPFQ